MVVCSCVEGVGCWRPGWGWKTAVFCSLGAALFAAAWGKVVRVDGGATGGAATIKDHHGAAGVPCSLEVREHLLEKPCVGIMRCILCLYMV